MPADPDARPDHQKDLSDNQKAFLDHAVEGLIEKGKVVPVRLSLFAWMVRGKPWTTETLRNVGGAEGVGLNFLEETFNSPHAEPKYRHHQRAAQAVLKSLLPEGGTRIRGEAKSYSELISASGYAHRPGDFEDLCRILDGEVRLITPTAREESSTTDQEELTKPIEQYYQLTHDYLVPSIREWLTRKQRETRRGRAELRLAELSSLWNSKPENRHLPSALEWANIRLLTRKKYWTEPQRKMMKRVGRVHGLRTLGLAALIALLTWGGIEGYGRLWASSLVESLRTARTTGVPVLVRKLDRYRCWANPRLKTLVENANENSLEKLHARLALLPADAAQVKPLYDWMVETEVPEFATVISQSLKPHSKSLKEELWTAVEQARPGDKRIRPVASALACYEPENDRWVKVSDKVAQALVSVNSVHLGLWMDALRP